MFRDVCAASELGVELWDLGGSRSAAQLNRLAQMPSGGWAGAALQRGSPGFWALPAWQRGACASQGAPPAAFGARQCLLPSACLAGSRGPGRVPRRGDQDVPVPGARRGGAGRHAVHAERRAGRHPALAAPHASRRRRRSQVGAREPGRCKSCLESRAWGVLDCRRTPGAAPTPPLLQQDSLHHLPACACATVYRGPPPPAAASCSCALCGR